MIQNRTPIEATMMPAIAKPRPLRAPPAVSRRPLRLKMKPRTMSASTMMRDTTNTPRMPPTESTVAPTAMPLMMLVLRMFTGNCRIEKMKPLRAALLASPTGAPGAA